MIIEIFDLFDLDRIKNSGQNFRIKKFPDLTYRFIYQDKILYIKEIRPNLYSISCSQKEWKNIWSPFFDLDTNYNQLTKSYQVLHPYINEATRFSSGLRVLKQDPLETLIGFILSQRKSIPSIESGMNKLAKIYGKKVTTPVETVSLFPTIEVLKTLNEADFKKLGFGYRAPYIVDAIKKVLEKDNYFKELDKKSDLKLINELKEIRGVGDKVANAVALFAFGRTGCAPIDVWILRAIEEEFGGENVFNSLGDDAGIIQAFIFYHQRNRK